jgi:hypothetical protein
LRHHFRRVPKGVQRHDFTRFVNLEDVYPLKADLSPLLTYSFSSPLYSRTVAGDENFIFRQAYFPESACY